MKMNFNFFCIVLFYNIQLFAMECPNCNAIGRLDDKIYLLDIGIKAQYSKAKDAQEKTIWEIVETQLIPELKFNEPDSFATRLSMISHVETITWLEMVVRKKIADLEFIIESTNRYPTDSPALWKERLVEINKRMDELFEKEFTLYRFTESSDKWLKGFYFEHGNDMFSAYNNDRDMTGSFRFEFITDQFKMRIFAGEHWWNLNSRSWYTYQTIFAGGEGYTPYLRDTTIFNSPTAVDSNDRPYAAFIYYGYSKHRVFRNGKFRMNSRIKVGTIGSAQAGGLQSIIHRDLNAGAYTPNGWDSQIAKGGRIAIQYELMHEYAILGKEWLVCRALRDKFDNQLQKFPKFINLSIFDEIKYGHDMTSVGAGFNIGTCDFKKSGDYIIPMAAGKNKYKNLGLALNYRFTYRHVFHNSMLEGYGITSHVKDEDPSSPTDNYILTRNQIKPWVQIHEAQISFKLRYVSILYKATFISPEYDLPVNTMTYQYGESGFTSNHNSSAWNHFGTVGFLFNIR